jgi:hypothetical protein
MKRLAYLFGSFCFGALSILTSCHRGPTIEELHQKSARIRNVHLIGRVWATRCDLQTGNDWWTRHNRPFVQELWSRVEFFFLTGSSLTISAVEGGGTWSELISGGNVYFFRQFYDDETEAFSSTDKDQQDIWDIESCGLSLPLFDSLWPQATPTSPPWKFGFPDPRNQDLLWFECPPLDHPSGSCIAEIHYRAFILGIRPEDGLIQASSFIYLDDHGRDEIITYAQIDTIEFGTVRPTDLRLPAAAARAN